MAADGWLRLRVPLGFIFAAWYLWLTRYARQEMLVVSTLMVVLGCGLRSWAAGYLLKGKRVAVGGPYAYIRNPLYLGSFLIGSGFCLALYQSPLPAAVLMSWFLYAMGFVLLYATKSRSEEEELVRTLGREYQAYRRRVPVFLPVHGKVAGLGVQRFSAELYRRNREYQCVMGSLAVLALLYWRTLYGS